jgi:16S rRNA (cytosine967-C5)-methyltransferase
LKIFRHVRVSFPKELFDLISNSFGMSKALEYCKVMNERAPLTVRANILKVTRDELFNIFKKKGFDVRKTEFSPYGISFNTNPRSNFFTMDEFKQGYFEVQDEGSQLVALKVDCKVSKNIFKINFISSLGI